MNPDPRYQTATDLADVEAWVEPGAPGPDGWQSLYLKVKGRYVTLDGTSPDPAAVTSREARPLLTFAMELIGEDGLLLEVLRACVEALEVARAQPS